MPDNLKIEKIWIDEITDLPICNLRMDFNNDRHFKVQIGNTNNPQSIARALHDLAQLVANDPVLNKQRYS